MKIFIIITIVIVCLIAIVLGLVFGLKKKKETPTFSCDKNTGQCVEDSSSKLLLGDCEKQCAPYIPPTSMVSCEPTTGNCVPDKDGKMTKADCEKSCTITPGPVPPTDPCLHKKCGHGTCEHGTCKCTDGWTGDSCQTPTVPSTGGGLKGGWLMQGNYNAWKEADANCYCPGFFLGGEPNVLGGKFTIPPDSKGGNGWSQQGNQYPNPSGLTHAAYQRPESVKKSDTVYITIGGARVDVPPGWDSTDGNSLADTWYTEWGDKVIDTIVNALSIVVDQTEAKGIIYDFEGWLGPENDGINIALKIVRKLNEKRNTANAPVLEHIACPTGDFANCNNGECTGKQGYTDNSLFEPTDNGFTGIAPMAYYTETGNYGPNGNWPYKRTGTGNKGNCSLYNLYEETACPLAECCTQLTNMKWKNNQIFITFQAHDLEENMENAKETVTFLNDLYKKGGYKGILGWPDTGQPSFTACATPVTFDHCLKTNAKILKALTAD